MSLAAQVLPPAVVLKVSPALLVLGLISLAFAIVVIVDMARRPSWQWAQAGSNKTTWLVVEIACLVLVGFFSIIVGALYFARVRPRLVAVERQGGGPGWPPSPGWPGSVPPTQAPKWATGAYPPPMPGSPGVPAGPGPSPPPYPGPGPAPHPGARWPSSPGAGLPPYPGYSAPPGPPSVPPAWVDPPSAPPFGWYPDPSGHHEKRYWDGTRWTEHVSDGDQRSIEPIPE